MAKKKTGRTESVKAEEPPSAPAPKQAELFPKPKMTDLLRPTKSEQQRTQTPRSAAAAKPPIASRLRTVVSKPWAVALEVAALLGAVAAILPVLPQIGISLAEPLRRADPFSVPMRVVNEGWLAAYDVRIRCRIVSAEIAGNTFAGVTLEDPLNDVPKMAHAVQQVVPCRLMQTEVLPASAQFAVTVHYKALRLWPSHECRLFEIAFGDTWRWLEHPCPDD